MDQRPLEFTETIILPSVPEISHIPKSLLDKTLESLHIILGTSYYKIHLAKHIKLPYRISQKEADFWNVVYKKGFGEFFYKNNLDPENSPEFPFSNNIKSNAGEILRYDRHLIGIGGGKDSIVSAELLRQHGFDITGFSVSSSDNLAKKVMERIGIGEITFQRHLDWHVFGEQKYKGHIPVSVIYAFLGVFAAVLYKYDSFVVSNEHSSNFGNIRYKGMKINHQWSKSLEFEKLFQEYLAGSISPSINYFSLLRPFYEIRIVKMFSAMEKYFSYFSSCNRNFTIKPKIHNGLWCKQCPKCAFTFLMLSAFLPKKKLLDIFDENLYEKKELLRLFKDVLGFGNMKPFDCVGTFEEAQTALFLTKNKAVLRKIEGPLKNIVKRAIFHPEVFQTNPETAIPDYLRFLGMENALILGYGREGKVTERYLKKYYPEVKRVIGDAAKSKDYLKKQHSFDIAIKTPGIKKELVTIPYTTATNIFFSRVKGKYSIVGITGSKGKSTTASLIYHILKTAGKNAVLLGNIGKPMLEALTNTQHLKPSTYIVLELSSYQLDDIHYSPDIAVVTTLFAEHMDFHGSLKSYYQAKKNIINFQDSRGTIIYNPDNSIMRQWLKGYLGKALPFSKKPYVSRLIGKHNQDNIGAAVAAAKVLGINDGVIKKAVKSFKPLEHRLEMVGTFKGITFYNDAISTTPDSTIAAIQALKNIDTIFLGGQDRGYSFFDLEKTIKKHKIRNIVLFPDSGRKIIRDKKSFNIFNTPKMSKAVKFAYKHTKKGGICLLSCASPSYSLWKNFEEKGKDFIRYVKKYGR